MSIPALSVASTVSPVVLVKWWSSLMHDTAPQSLTTYLKAYQLIRAIGAEGLNRRGPAGSCRLFLGPGFRLGARWNRLVETVKTRKKREKTGKKWARYGLKRVNKERKGGITWEGDVYSG